MQKYRDTVTDGSGNAILSSTVTITDNPGGGVSTIYSDDGVTAKANPFTASGVDGVYEFYAANGRYDITIAATGFDTEQLLDILLNDHADAISSVNIDSGKIDGTVIGASSAAAGTFTAFTSTGIDDNATSIAITIDSSENVGIGNSSLESWQSIKSVLQLGGNASLAATTSQAGDGSFVFGQNIYRDATGNKYISTDEASRYYQQTGTHIFEVAASGTADTAITWNKAITIQNDGDISIGGIAPGSELFYVEVDGGIPAGFNRVSDDGLLVVFRQDGSNEGSISISGTTTSYNTSSDIRLKENFKEIPNALSVICDMQPWTFNFKKDPDNTVYGFAAQELNEVYPQAVFQGDNENSMWSVDYGKLTPILVAAIQELSDQIKDLKESKCH